MTEPQETITLGGQICTIDREQGTITLGLTRGYLLYNLWKKFKWPEHMPSVGVNQCILEFALQNHLILEVVVGKSKKSYYYFNPDGIEQALQRNWISCETWTGLRIYALPVMFSTRRLKSAKAKAESNKQKVLDVYAR